MKTNLGTIPLSNDILNKSNIGLWAFELDEGEAPRMYVDDTMLKLIGLTEQVSPEETYHAWYDHVSPNHYDKVHEAIKQMEMGIHAEVQYPWHHPNGTTVIVRCGGVRNPAYTKGLRIEGVHRDVTEVLHFQKERERVNEAMSTLLAEDYYAAFYVNIAAKSFVCISVDKTASEFTEKLQNEPFDNIHETFRRNYVQIIAEEDREKFLSFTHVDNIYASLLHKKHDTITVKVMRANNQYVYIQIHIVLVKKEDDHVVSFVLTFQNAGEDMHKILTLYDIIDALAANYQFISGVDLKTDTIEVYKDTTRGKSLLGNNFADRTYSKLIEEYTACGVAERDKQNLRQVLAPDYIRKTLSTSPHFKQIYLNSQNLYSEMKYVPFGEDKIILAIGTNDTEIRADILQKQLAKENEHTTLRSDFLECITSGSKNTIEYLKEFTTRLRKLLGCDQIIYRELNGTEIIDRAPEISSALFRDEIFCTDCIFYSVMSPAYINGVLEISEPSSSKTIKRHDKCPVISSLSRLTYCGERVSGCLHIHYVTKPHTFTDIERKTVEDFCRIISLSLSHNEMIRQNIDLERKNQLNEMANALSANYEKLLLLNMQDRTYKSYPADSSSDNKADFFKTIVIDALQKVHPEDRSAFAEFYSYEALNDIAAKRITKEAEFRKQSGSGYRWECSRVAPVIDLDNNINLVIGITDNTEQHIKEAREKEIQQQRAFQVQRLNTLYDMIHSGQWAFHFDNEMNFLRADFSGILTTNLKNTCDDDMCGWIRKVHPEDQERVRQASLIALYDTTGSTLYDIDFRMQNTDGEYRWYHTAGRTIRDNNGNTEFFGIHIDITEQIDNQIRQQKQLEEALSMAQSASKAKTAFLSNMSHDIRTPMNAIIGFAELAGNHIDNKEKVQHCISKINKSSQHLLSLINDVLDMSYIESGRMNLTEEAEDINDILYTITNIIQADIAAKQLNFEFNTVNIKDETIYCDKLRLNQIFINILSNAIKYTPAGGTITLLVEETHTTGDYGCFKFVVRDTGIGMNPEFLKIIFEPFTRVKSSTVSGIQGTGLGMAITKNIVDMMGGNINIDSEEGSGTTVTITFNFRIAQSKKDTGSKIEAEDLSFNNKSILLVEDNELNREIAHELLADYGFNITDAEDGSIAVDMIKSGNNFDIILMDIQMPVLNGFEATKQIRDLGNTVPIIAMTANAFDEDRTAALNAGMNEHIAKPINTDKLIEVLKSFLH